MIVDSDFVRPIRADDIRYWPCTRRQAEEYIAHAARTTAWPADGWLLEPYPACLVCGEVGYNSANRCWRHGEHTPCAVPGCTKGRKFKDGCWDDATWVCGIHWREVCPPRSALRRTYLRFYRTARRLGVEKGPWPAELKRRYWRFFRGLIARHRRRLGVDGGDVVAVELASADELPVHLAQELRRAGLA